MQPRLLYAFPEPLPLRKARAVQVMHTIDALARAGMGVDLAYVPTAGTADPFVHYGLHCPENVRLVPLSRCLPKPLSGLRIHSNRLFLWRLRHWIENQNKQAGGPTVVFVRHVKLAHALLDAFPTLPLIYEAHEIFAQTSPRLFPREKAVIEHATALIAITGRLAEAVNRFFGLQRLFAIVPSATTLPQVSVAKDWAAISKRIVYAGNLYDWKGVDDLIIAARELPGCHIMIIGGDAIGIARLRNLLSPTGANIDFAGHLSHQEVLKHMGNACIAVLPNRSGSVSEFTSPLKLFEYMAAGCAIVCSDLPAVREIVEDNEAVWFSPGDPGALASAIKSLVDDPERARSMAELTAAKARSYSWDSRAERLLEIIHAVSNK